MTKGYDESEVVNRAIKCFSVTHRTDAFYPGQEPIPGTFSCRTCNVDLTDGVKIQWLHAFKCQKKAHHEEALIALKEKCPFDRPCQFQKIDRDGSFRDCGLSAKNWKQFYGHLKGHLITSSQTEKKTSESSTRIWYCWFDGCAMDTSPRGKKGVVTNLRIRPPVRFCSGFI